MRLQMIRGAAVCAVLALVCGCRSPKEPGGAGLAHVTIKGTPLYVIQDTAEAVFRENGYRIVEKQPTLMVFDRQGSKLDALAWGGWSGEGVVMRVKVSITGQPPEEHLLEARVYAVRDASDPFFADESRMVLIKRGPYRKMLEEVRRRLNPDGKSK
ncbi:MAG TPA: hypothetical protein VNO52_02515 [Methylomirabilota bacterium]|nr:hypothetical protein [Methylomirabilota bacterium]